MIWVSNDFELWKNTWPYLSLTFAALGYTIYAQVLGVSCDVKVILNCVSEILLHERAATENTMRLVPSYRSVHLVQF